MEGGGEGGGYGMVGDIYLRRFNYSGALHSIQAFSTILCIVTMSWQKECRATKHFFLSVPVESLKYVDMKKSMTQQNINREC